MHAPAFFMKQLDGGRHFFSKLGKVKLSLSPASLSKGLDCVLQVGVLVNSLLKFVQDR